MSKKHDEKFSDKPKPEPDLGPKPAATGQPNKGVLHAAREGLIILGGDKAASEHPTADSVAVHINGKEYDGLHELRRGDHVQLLGEPVHTVHARR